MFKNCKLTRNSVPPTSKSFKIIWDAVKDALMPAKMAAFELVAKQLQPFLAIFQSDNPLLPFMASTSAKGDCGTDEEICQGWCASEGYLSSKASKNRPLR